MARGRWLRPGHLGSEGDRATFRTLHTVSLMTAALKGLSIEEARNLFRGFHGLVTQGSAGEDLGDLAVFTGVREYPMRVKCATLPWHALMAALDAPDQPVSTE